MLLEIVASLALVALGVFSAISLARRRRNGDPGIGSYTARSGVAWACTRCDHVVDESPKQPELASRGPRVVAPTGYRRYREQTRPKSTVHRSGPYRFYIYSHEPGEAPYIHVDRDDKTAKFWLAPAALAFNLGFLPSNSGGLRAW